MLVFLARLAPAKDRLEQPAEEVGCFGGDVLRVGLAGTRWDRRGIGSMPWAFRWVGKLAMGVWVDIFVELGR